jgi:hypothetical protein
MHQLPICNRGAHSACRHRLPPCKTFSKDIATHVHPHSQPGKLEPPLLVGHLTSAGGGYSGYQGARQCWIRGSSAAWCTPAHTHTAYKPCRYEPLPSQLHHSSAVASRHGALAEPNQTKVDIAYDALSTIHLLCDVGDKEDPVRLQSLLHSDSQDASCCNNKAATTGWCKTGVDQAICLYCHPPR